MQKSMAKLMKMTRNTICYHEYVTGSHKGATLGITALLSCLTVLCAFIFIDILTPIALLSKVRVFVLAISK